MGAVGFALGTTSGGTGAAAFVPTDISGCMLWLKADSLTLNDADPISTWTDSSGNSNTATSTLTTRPLYKTAILNSLPVVRCDGSNDFMTVTRNAGLEPNNVTLFAVVKAGSNPAAFSYMLSKKLTSGSSASYSMGVDGSSRGRGLFKVATTGEVVTTFIPTAIIWDNFAHIHCIKADGSLLKHWLNGSAQFTNSAGSATNNTSTAVGNITYDSNDLLIGAYDSGSLFWAGDIGEILIYNTALSDANRWSVQGYLGNKWAVP